MDEETIWEYLCQFMSDELADRSLSSKHDVFNGMTAREFAEQEGWGHVFGIYKRMYGKKGDV